MGGIKRTVVEQVSEVGEETLRQVMEAEVERGKRKLEEELDIDLHSPKK